MQSGDTKSKKQYRSDLFFVRPFKQRFTNRIFGVGLKRFPTV